MKTNLLMLIALFTVSTVFLSCEKEDENLKGKSYTATETMKGTITFTTASQGTLKLEAKEGPTTITIELNFTYTYTKPNVEIITVKIDDNYPSIKLNGSIEGKKLTLYDEDGDAIVFTEN